MWIFFSILSAVFSGITSILAKAGISKIDSTFSTSIRTSVILIITSVFVLLDNSTSKFNTINSKTLFFLVLSGIATAMLWIFYFKALDLGNVNLVTPIDKTSIILTLILSAIFLKEKITIMKTLSIILILIGIYLMILNKNINKTNNKNWIKYAVLTSIFSSIVTILGKVGIKNINSNLGCFIKTSVVFIIVWIITIFFKKFKNFKKLDKKSLLFIILSGISTSLSWICYFKALKDGEASIVFTIEKLSIIFAILGASIFLKEKLNNKIILGLTIVSIGIGLLLIK